MRKLLFVIITTILISCSKPNDNQYLSVSENFLNLPNQSGTVFINISSNCDWKIISNLDWVIIVPSKGKGNSKVNLLVKSNLNAQAREGVISVVYKDEIEQSNSRNDIFIKQSIPLLEDYNKLIDSIYVHTYDSHGKTDAFGQKAIDYALDCLGEDFFPTEKGYGWFIKWYQYLEHRDFNSINLLFAWNYYYEIIDKSNKVIFNINNINIYENQLNERKYLEAQALFFRAHSYYMLVQLFAERFNYESGQNDHLGVPIKNKSNDEPIFRETVANVYKLIKNDLKFAQELLHNNPAVQIFPSKITLNSIYAIHARVSLTTGDWENASSYAKKAYEGKSLEKDYSYGFDYISTEWIWGANIPQTYAHIFDTFFSHIDPYFGGFASFGNQRVVSLSLYNFMQNSDIRKKLFINHNNKERVGIKFTGGRGVGNDYLYIKAGEMYLIEAEAEARRLNDAAAQDALYALISKRDPAYVKSTLTGEALIEHILMHRRADLWGEGQRFLDIKRLNKGMDRRDLGHNPAQWNAASNFPAGDKNFVFLIPKQEIDANPNMVQNPL